MAPIERKPLPPPNANVTTLTEDDRSELLAGANEVINHYLSGPGSYWDEGPRKPLEETLSDLRAFQSQVAALQQLADDPGRILDSAAGLVDGAIDRVKRAIEDSEGRDGIWVAPPETNDRIVRAPTSAPMGISYLGSTPGELSADRGRMQRIATPVLSERTIEKKPAAAPDARIAPQSETSQGAPLLQGAPLFGLVSGKSMSFYPVQPPIWVLERSAPNADADDWLTRLLQGTRSQ